MSVHPWNEFLLASLASRAERLPHAMLIHGVQGVGKLALAERIAQLILCEAGEGAPKPCGRCDGCRWYAAGNHPDFRRVEPEALAPQQEAEDGEAPAARRAKPSLEIKVDQVRELADFLNLRSHRGRRRVALVHPAEEMNASAANALLKGLEEPPAAAMFLLVSHRPARLLPTIRSRCISVPVPIPAQELALSWLAGQGVKTPERWLAYSGGAPLRAVQHAASGESLERLLHAVADGKGLLVDDREALEALAEALQRIAIDRALAAYKIPPKYRTTDRAVAPGQAKAWLDFARLMGKNRRLARHPLNPRLFSAEMLAAMPVDEDSK